MNNRREFLQSTVAAAAALLTADSRSVFAADQPRMGTRLIPRTDEKLPIVGLGNADAFTSGNDELARQLVSLLLDRGGSYIDTTGQSRFSVASIMKEQGIHARLFPGTYVAATGEAEIRRDLAAVREAQGTVEPLDLVLTRNIDAYASRPNVYSNLKKDGITRYIGVARHQEQYHQTMVDLMQADQVDFLQVNYSMLEPQAENTVLPLARDKGVAILINRPFINGRYFSLVRGQELPEWAADFDCKSWAQFAVKWILGNPAVNCVITETSDPKHAVDNLAAGIGRLPDEKTRRRMRDLILTLA
jgi:aryl-alcohol dehydrogenase-like predicted oxidoreductase